MNEEKLTLEKAQMYSTAYSRIHNRFVKIDKVRKDDRGELIFTGSCDEFDYYCFRQYELERFTL